MVGESDSGSIKHLQKEIPYQPMSFFDFIKKEDALPMLGKNFSQSSGAARFVAHK